MNRHARLLALVCALFVPTAAWSQATVLQGGGFASGHIPIYSNGSVSGAAVVRDSGYSLPMFLTMIDIGVTPLTGGSPGQCLIIGSGVVSSAVCGSGSSGNLSVYNNIAGLEAASLTGLPANTPAMVLGYYASGDDGGVSYYLSTSACSLNASAGDGGSQIKPNAGTGCWLANFASGDVSVKWFGAKGDGVTDDYAAMAAALQYASANGGGTVYGPPGHYLLSNGLGCPALTNWPSNVSFKGAGANATFLENSGLTACNGDLYIFGTLTGNYMTATTYPINAPTQGNNYVMTTTAANAGNFAPGNYVMISGPPVTNYWSPTWTGQIQSVNASTGQITLTEPIPFGGSAWTLVQKIVTYIQNVKVSDLAFEGSCGAAAQNAQNVIFENIQLINGQCAGQAAENGITLAATRNSIVEDIQTSLGDEIDVISSYADIVEDNFLNNSYLVLDGQSMNIIVADNVITNANKIVSGSLQPIASVYYDGPQDIISNNQMLTNPYYALEGNGNNSIDIGNMIGGQNTSGGGCGSFGSATVNNQEMLLGNQCIDLEEGFRIGGVAVSTNVLADDNIMSSISAPSSQYIIGAGSNVRQPFDGNIETTLDSSTTPSVANGDVFVDFDGSPTSVTTFSNGVANQEITVVFGTANTTLVDGTNLQLAGGVNYTPPSQTIMKLKSLDGVKWYEESRAGINSGLPITNLNNLSALASTTSAQLASVISDETGMGPLAFATNPALIAPSNVTYTIAAGPNQLPATATLNTTAFVSDQLTSCPATGAALTGGGAVRCPVFWNGSAWVGN